MSVQVIIWSIQAVTVILRFVRIAMEKTGKTGPGVRDAMEGFKAEHVLLAEALDRDIDAELARREAAKKAD
ncbi:MAG: hypothetical protein ACR2P3_05205 [Geminicoccaceae bacterium]